MPKKRKITRKKVKKRGRKKGTRLTRAHKDNIKWALKGNKNARGPHKKPRKRKKRSKKKNKRRRLIRKFIYGKKGRF